MGQEPQLDIKPADSGEVADIVPLVLQLRPHLETAELILRLTEQGELGYRLHVARLNGQPVGLVGLRPMMTLARGAYIHIDDMVVAEGFRHAGIGRALLRFAEAEAKRRGMRKVFLDARLQVMPYYEAQGYVPHFAQLMRKDL